MNLLVADDHALVRQGLLRLMADAHPDWQIDEAGTLDEALAVLSAKPVDLLVLDLNMPGMDRDTSLHALREGYPETRIAILTGNEDRSVILECLSAGVHGYILKSDAVTQLVFAIESVLAGHVYVPPSLTRLVQVPDHAPQPAPPPQRVAGFTPRQREVLVLLAEGRSTKDIARRLDLGVGTVKVHLAGVYRVLGAQNRMEAVVKAGKVILED
jgi:DNA-binding NarL/FixJ family response regulator